MVRGFHMRKIILFAAVMLVLIGIGTWVGVSALAGSTVYPSRVMTGAKGSPIARDDYDLVVY
jgi:hypothetical protein